MLRKNLDLSQTIFALASGRLPSAVAIVKLSGVDTFTLSQKIFRPASGEVFDRKRALTFGSLFDLEAKKIDDVLALGFVAPNSHTGEDTVEFHCHGSVPVIQKLEDTLLKLGARPAEKGEFTYRAHLNGRVTPEEVEGLGDIFLAKQVGDLDRIYARREGSLQQKISDLRANLVRVQAILDTAVDFSEEYSNVVDHSRQPVEATIRECSEIIQRYSAFKSGEAVPRLVLAGLPNAGKSSLFNSLLGRYRAIVHEEAGTTRDAIEEDVQIQGRRWKLVDTAGIRESNESRERQGIEMGEQFLSGSQFWILVVDGTLGITPEEERLIDLHGSKQHLIVWNKKDLPAWNTPKEKWYESSILPLSAQSGEGIVDLWKRLEAELVKLANPGPLPTAVQCSRLERAAGVLDELRVGLEAGLPPEVLSEKNRQAMAALESVVGEVTTEDVLDRVFGEFCIGK